MSNRTVRALKLSVPQDFYEMLMKTAKAAGVSLDVLGRILLENGYAFMAAETELAKQAESKKP